ncbi:hypothetical protein CMMCAS08_06895 [Clavibacter michiganensis subsp. michiganensis]|nr:hypothetical protein CMMCAS08_06895 [Clavibacter michiganensis subsp. michiganensis]
MAGSRPGTQTPAAARDAPWSRRTSSGAPSARIPPSAPSTTTRSTRSCHTATRCSMTTRVAPLRSTTDSTARRTSPTPSGSRLAVGSSRRRSPGRIARTPARARRCFWPPESAVVERSRATSSPTASSAARTRIQISSRGTPRFSQPNATSSPTRERITCASGSCSTSPARPRREAGSCPSTSRVPRASPSSSPPRTPARACMSVVLPAPDTPSSSTRSPGSMTRSTSRTAQALRPACRQPQPAARTDRRATARPPHGQTRAAVSRPEAKRERAPVRASARATSHESSPAMTAPETSAAIV